MTLADGFKLACFIAGINALLWWSPAVAKADPREPCAIQGRLKALGYYPGNITCKIGPKTMAAIEKFQEDKGIDEDAVGDKTFKALFGIGRIEAYTHSMKDLKANGH